MSIIGENMTKRDEPQLGSIDKEKRERSTWLDWVSSPGTDWHGRRCQLVALLILLDAWFSNAQRVRMTACLSSLCLFLLFAEVLSQHWLSRFAHSTDSSMFAWIACHIEVMEDASSKGAFPFCSYSTLLVVSFHRRRERRAAERKKKMRKCQASRRSTEKKWRMTRAIENDDDDDDDDLPSYQRTEDHRLTLMMMMRLRLRFFIHYCCWLKRLLGESIKATIVPREISAHGCEGTNSILDWQLDHAHHE